MKKFAFLFVGFSFLFSYQSSATHLMGGQITVSQLSGLSYEIKMVGYRDTSGIPMYLNATFVIEDMNSAFTDSITVSHNGMNPFFNGVEVYEYIGTYVFPASGQYRIHWEDCCRNGAIRNMSNPLGEEMYLMTEVSVDVAATNSTPVFLNPPITLAQKFSLFQYNPLPFDADGDSLAWLMETPLSYAGDTVAGYTLPHADTSNPFTLNPMTGELTWMPDSNGHWEASFRVEEYRSGVKIGEIRRDMQIIVVDDTTNWFSLVFNNSSWPQDAQGNFSMAIAPNSPFNLTLNATDQDYDQLSLNVQGEPMILSNNPAQWNIINFGPGNITGTFSWTPQSSQARMAPYILAFRGSEHHNQSVFTRDQTLLLYVSISAGISDIQHDYSIGKVFPNPSSGEWFLSFNLKNSSHINIDIVDIVGQKVAVVLNQSMPAGTNLIGNQGLKLNSGFYFVHVKVNNEETVSYPLIIK